MYILAHCEEKQKKLTKQNAQSNEVSEFYQKTQYYYILTKILTAFIYVK